MPRGGRPPKEPDLTTYAGRLGARLRALRTERGMTVADVREALAGRSVAVTEDTVRAWERGSRSPSLENIQPLAATYGVSADDVLPAE